MLWTDCFEWLFFIFLMIYHVIVLQLLFYFHSISPLPLTFWWHGMFKIIGHFPQSWVGRGGGGWTGWSQPPPPVPLCSFVSPWTLTQLTHVYMCDAISFMTYDVSDLERFPISPEVMPCRFIILRTNFRFLTFLAWENVKWTLLGSFLWLDDKQ